MWSLSTSGNIQNGSHKIWAEHMTSTQAALGTGKEEIVDPMSTATMKLIECIVQVGLMPPIVVLGVLFNVVNIVVFMRQGLSDHINFCLSSLSVSDAGYLISLIIHRAYAVADLISDIAGEYYKSRMANVIGLYCAFSTTSNCLTMLIAVERCVCVVWPLKAKVILTTRNIRVLGVLAYFVCFPINILFCFKYDVLVFVAPETNVTHYRPTVTSFYRRNARVYDFVYENFNIVVPTVAFCVVILCTMIIAVRMRSVVAWRQKWATVTRKDTRVEASVTRMLTVICVIFTVSMVPYVICAFTRLVVPEFRPEGHYTNSLYASTGIMHLIMCINSSVNFLVYYNMSFKFKSTLKAMIHCKGKGGGRRSRANFYLAEPISVTCSSRNITAGNEFSTPLRDHSTGTVGTI